MTTEHLNQAIDFISNTVTGYGDFFFNEFKKHKEANPEIKNLSMVLSYIVNFDKSGEYDDFLNYLYEYVGNYQIEEDNGSKYNFVMNLDEDKMDAEYFKGLIVHLTCKFLQA